MSTKFVMADSKSVDEAATKAKEFLKINAYYADAKGTASAAITEYILFTEGKTIRKQYVTIPPSKVEIFLSRKSGKKLLATHKLTEHGIWRVYGEDPNCSIAGHHYQPFLGAFEGTLEKVLTTAVNLQNFWQWGDGGKIEKFEVQKI